MQKVLLKAADEYLEEATTIKDVHYTYAEHFMLTTNLKKIT